MRLTGLKQHLPVSSTPTFALVFLALIAFGIHTRTWATGSPEKCEDLGTATCNDSQLNVDLSPQFPAENKDQIGGTCYANAATSIVEAALYRNSKDCSRKGMMPEFCACQWAATCTKDPNSPGFYDPQCSDSRGSVDGGSPRYYDFLCQMWNAAARDPKQANCFALDTPELRAEMENQLNPYRSMGEVAPTGTLVTSPTGAVIQRLQEACACCSRTGSDVRGGGACACGLANLLKQARSVVEGITGKPLPVVQPKTDSCAHHPITATSDRQKMRDAFIQLEASRLYSGSQMAGAEAAFEGYVAYLKEQADEAFKNISPDDPLPGQAWAEATSALSAFTSLAAASDADFAKLRDAYEKAFANLLANYYAKLRNPGNPYYDKYNKPMKVHPPFGGSPEVVPWAPPQIGRPSEYSMLTDILLGLRMSPAMIKSDGSLIKEQEARDNCANEGGNLFNQIVAKLCQKVPVGVNLMTDRMLFGKIENAGNPNAPVTPLYPTNPDFITPSTKMQMSEDPHVKGHGNHAMVATGVQTYCFAYCGTPQAVMKTCLVLRNSWGHNSEVAIVPFDESCRLMDAHTMDLGD